MKALEGEEERGTTKGNIAELYKAKITEHK